MERYEKTLLTNHRNSRYRWITGLSSLYKMSWIFALLGIFLIALAFSVSPRIGGLLVLITVLGIWLTAQRKGMFQNG